MRRPVYYNWCPRCGAEPRKPCRTARTRLVTDTHAARIRHTNMVHDITRCEGELCVLHNPSDHHMLDWPMTRRFDLRPPIVERVCDHGVGHPDPDSAAWAERVVREDDLVWQNNRSDGKYVWIHGCDGCCAESPSGASATVVKDKRGDWTWFCEADDCGWYGIGCPSEPFAEREAGRHFAEAHTSASGSSGVSQ